MATERAPTGIAHPTVVPENFDPREDEDASADGREGDESSERFTAE